MSESGLQAEVDERVAAVRARMKAAAARAGRANSAVTLVGVSKRQPAERVAAGVRAGVSQLGENYVQEAREKQARVAKLLAGESPRALPVWRMIGRLQRNKVRQAALVFDAVESVDRAQLLVELDRRAEQAGRILDVLIQVNLSGESQKGGVPSAQVPAILQVAAPLANLRIQGLMTVPAANPDPEASRPVFAQLRELRDRLLEQPNGQGLHVLSMGMSHDFEVAIEEGANVIRVGTAVFGPREETR